jgi:hypothetical protein
LSLLLRQHEGQSVVDDISTVIVKRLILVCDTTTSITIAYTPVLLSPEVSYAKDSFSKYYCERYNTTGRAGKSVRAGLTAL